MCGGVRTGLGRVRGRYFKVQLSVQSRGRLFKGQHLPLMNDSTTLCPSPTLHQDQLEEVLAGPMGLQRRIDSVFICVCVRGRASPDKQKQKQQQLCVCVYVKEM